jgi:divalent metal cation (Fe/Co/Zn/Cd) transporter
MEDVGVSTVPSRAALQRLALRLEYATIVWNIGEAVFTVSLGIVAGSLALIGFGTDSVIEVFASAVVVWHVRPGHAEDAPGRTRTALRLVAVAFLALAMALAAVALRDLMIGRRAGASPWGIAYLSAAAVVMFGLAFWKRRVATALRSAPLRSEANLTFLDGVLSALTLTGLSLNAALGWWWADPLAALIVAVAAANESREILREVRELARR